MNNKLKHSGIEWIGEIPSDWKINKLKYLTINTNTGEAISKEFWNSDGDYLLYTAGQFPIRSTFNKFPKNIMTTKNDNLVARNGAGAVQIPQLGSIYTDHVIRFTIKMDSCLKFIYYTLLLGMEKIVSEAIDVSLKTLSRSDWDNLSLPFPVLSEQNAIAAFLDTQCSKIDNIITELEQQIEILKQYKTSLITETVTKGLNKKVPMKNSGIDWIGKIPSHWEVIRLKYLLESALLYGANEAGIPYENEIPRYIRITDITHDGNLKNDELLSLDWKTAKPYILKNGDILFARSGATVGKTFYFENRHGVSAFAGYLIKASIRSDKYYSKFIYYFTLTYTYEIWKTFVFTQATIQNIAADKYANCPIICPSLSEQKNIVAFLDNKCKEIKDIITEKQQSIDTMKAYKKSLIYEYVTGKKRVKGYS